MWALAYLSVPKISFLSISPLWDGPCIPHASGPPPYQSHPRERASLGQ